jgi:hypothetical protein
VSRPLPLLKLVSQTDVKDIKHADDCGPSTSAMAIFRGTAGRIVVGWREVRAAMAKRGIVDKEGESNYTTVSQNIRAIKDIAPELKDRLIENPTWAKVRENLEAGGGVGLAYYYAAAPKEIWSPLVSTGAFQHFVYAEAGDFEALWYDPMYKVGAKPKSISWGTLESLACWGLGAKSQHNKKIIGFIVLPPTIAAEAPRSDAEASKPQSGTKTPPAKPQASTSRKSASSVDPAVQTQLDALKQVNWQRVGAEALNVAQDAAAAASKEKSAMGKIGAWLKYVADNTKIDEMLLDALRTFLTVSISVALGLGIPLLDITGGDFRTILSAGLASALSVLVKALDPNQSEYGFSRK